MGRGWFRPSMAPGESGVASHRMASEIADGPRGCVMRLLHFDCFSGISGDMTLGALFDAGAPTQPVLDALASLGLPITVEVEKIRKGGFAATQVRVEAPEEE